MEFINKQKYDILVSKAKNSKYYNGRWPYISKVIYLASKLESVQTCLELGPGEFKLSYNSDSMDISDKYLKPTYHIDASKTPWPIKDNKYDLVIGLQVFEHLINHQEVFKEVKRVSRYAILSFPYKWKKYDDRHKNIDESVINYWMCGIKPKLTRLVDDRIIYLWNFV